MPTRSRFFGISWSRWVLIATGFLVAVIVINQYFFCPQYNFTEPRPFTGKHWYNPYEDIDTLRRFKCNFHAHSRAWMGLTNGNGSEQEVWDRYASLNYDVHCISNYHCISRFNDTAQNYLSAYEHGYNIKKNHYLLLNYRQVSFRDYPLPQTAHNKQHLIALLQPAHDELLAINHPSLRHAFSERDLALLSGYQGMEVLRSRHTHSYREWDAALSAGKPAFLLANDDLHDVHDAGDIGLNCTFVFAPALTASDLVQALRTGRSYGLRIGGSGQETFEDKQRKARAGLPALKSLLLRGDSLTLELSEPASEIRFIGQGGIQRARHQGVSATYVLDTNDTYVRAHIIFPDSSVMLLNPVFRYNQEPLLRQLPSINPGKTWLMRICGVLLLIIYLAATVMLAYRLNIRQNKI
ncbi:MAG: hypothetical protein RMK52_02840 [Chitinophagales bacterium]|nr:hypothetical protein [Chitinophagales bacterium]MDW8393160.1 hypothetical protein [Chitinophagales bacterium]